MDRRWLEDEDGVLDAAAVAALDVTLEPNARGTEIAETPRRITLEVASAGVRMDDLLYKFVLDSVVFASTGSNGTKPLAIGVDTADNELDWFVDQPADLYWGESTPTGVSVTALGAKFTSEVASYVDALSDGNSDLQCAWLLTGTADQYKVRYGRVDKDGVVEQAAMNLFTPDTDRRYQSCAMGLSPDGTELWWILTEEVWSAGFGALQSIRWRFAKTDLTGAVVFAPAVIDYTQGVTDTASRVEMAVDSNGFVHVVWWISGTPTASYFKINSTGGVIIGYTAAAKFQPPAGWDYIKPFGIFADSQDRLHAIFAAARNSHSGLGFQYVRLDTNGDALVPMTQFASNNGTTGGTAAMHPTRNEIYVMYPLAGSSYLYRLEPLDASGRDFGQLAPSVSL